jgi:hypothetical protein
MEKAIATKLGMLIYFKTLRQMICLTLGLMVLLLGAPPAQARNDKYLLPIKAALESTEAGEKPDGSVRFYFGKPAAAPAGTKLATVTPHGKANTRRTDDVKACNAAFLAALVEFQKYAKKAGANGVVNIVSYYKNVEMASPTEFECHAGVAAHAILRGDLVKMADH